MNTDSLPVRSSLLPAGSVSIKTAGSTNPTSPGTPYVTALGEASRYDFRQAARKGIGAITTAAARRRH